MSPSQSPTAAPSDSPTSPNPAGSPLFMPPQQPKSPPQPSQTQEFRHLDGSPSQIPAVPDPSWSTDGSPSSAPEPAEDSATPSIGKGVRLSKAGLRTGIGTGFRRVCKLLAVYLADEEEREFGLWVPDEDDVQDIAAPAANIVYRRLPEEARGGDVIDIIALGLAVAGYVGKNLKVRAQIRGVRQLQEAQGINVDPGAAP